MLQNTQKEAKYLEVEAGTVFLGYKSIHIQKLLPNTQEKIGSSAGKNVWITDKVKEVYCYEESCPLG